MWVDSKIGKWELIREVDTTVVIINGSVIGHTHPTDTAFTEPLPHASISFTRSSDSKYHRVEADSAGNFSIHLEPGCYKLLVGYTGLSMLEVQNIPVQSGELRQLTAVLGTRYGATRYLSSEDGSFIKKD